MSHVQIHENCSIILSTFRFLLQQEMPCKYKCGQSFSNVVELFRHSEVCVNNDKCENQDDNRSNQSFEESFMSDNNSSSNNNNNSCGGDPNNSSDERKVRVRTLISDEQLAVLKAHYLHNPRPKREDLEKIADQIGHPFKVVKVWFQNSRARDRREGKPANSGSSPHHHDLGGVPSAAAAALAAHLPFFMNSGAPGTTPCSAGQPGGPFPFLNNNFPPVNAAALMAAGLLPRMGGLMHELFGQKNTHQDRSSSPHSDSKSLCSLSASEDDNDAPVTVRQEAVNTAPAVKSSSDQPLDLSNKGLTSPSVSPVSRDDRSVTPAGIMRHNASPMLHWSQHPFNLGRQSGENGSARSPLDLYRFPEENDGTSSSNEEEGNYVCDKDKCDKTFTKRSSLTRHKYEHSGRESLSTFLLSLSFSLSFHFTG